MSIIQGQRRRTYNKKIRKKNRTKIVCIHGHFYQPPRENPWLESIELQDSAYPFHDWNERITSECYEPNTTARILSKNQIVDIQNNYENISFNFGPTLLSWMEAKAPEAYKAIIRADKKSMQHFSGHGSALAQAYNHMIMPLANKQDKETQVIWGIKDFQHRFHRFPEGMWLPETAVDTETLEILAKHKILFTILAPRQAGQVRKIGEEKWQEFRGEEIDPRQPYLCKLPSGKSIVLFFYDGPISKDIAFQSLLRDGEGFAKRIMSLFKDSDTNQVVHMATDGETYGHHHRYGEMALAYCLNYIKKNNLAKLTIYGEYLEKFKPQYEVKIRENTSWSCAHGVERWRANCGCHTGGQPGWTQQWRKPLRDALNWLRDQLTPMYSHEMGQLGADPWKARNDYIEVILDRRPEKADQLICNNTNKPLEKEDRIRMMKLLEMQRHVMLMFTSCGWFFDEVSGIETVQILCYAARAIQLARETGGRDLEPDFLKILATAPSNKPEYKDAKELYIQKVKPTIIDLTRVGAHYAISSLFYEYPKTTTINSYEVKSHNYERTDFGRQKLATGKITIISKITGEESALTFAVAHFGDHNIVCGVKGYMEDHPFYRVNEQLKQAFDQGNIARIIHLLDEEFPLSNYTFWHLFKDEQRNIMDLLLENRQQTVENTFRQLFHNNYSILRGLNALEIPVPKTLNLAGEVVLNTELRKIFEQDKINFDELNKKVDEFNLFSFELDKKTLSFVINRKMNLLVSNFAKEPYKIELITSMINVFEVLKKLPVKPELWKIQNIYFFIGQSVYHDMKEKSKQGDQYSESWLQEFENLGKFLEVRFS